MLVAASVARESKLAQPFAGLVHVYDQLVVPVAGCHEAPPSVDTSTRLTPDSVSDAVPVTL
jgi:hypothetical protein